MVKVSVRRRKEQAGQAILLVMLAMSIFMLGALGFIIDGSHLHAQRAMAQAAADAAAQAGMMSIFDGTSGAWGTYSGATASGVAIPCSATPPNGMSTSAACKYAQSLNGFNLSGDTVTVTPNPTVTICTSNSCLSSDPVNLLQVTVTRSVPTTLMRLLGPSASTVTAVGIAAIVQVTSPTPILITHPTMSGALNMNGNTSVTICGGPTQSVQVNSSNATAYQGPSSGSVDLSHAGPGLPSSVCAATGNTTTGTGANFGVFGGPATNPGNVTLGTSGQYVSPHSPILDPLAGVSPPSVPSGSTKPSGGQSCTILSHCGNCPASGFSGTPPSTCQEYVPGLYSSIDTTGISSSFFDPGIYYIEGGGFTMKNSTVGMCTSCTADPTTVNGMVIYDTCAGTQPCPAGSDATGGFTVDTRAYAQLLGAGVAASSPSSPPSSPYYGILFFEDHNADGQSHTIGAGNGCFSVIGTIYITNTLAIMTANAAHYQTVLYHGTPCTGVANYGEIIVSQLTVKGTSGIDMGLFPTGYLKIRQVALVD